MTHYQFKTDIPTLTDEQISKHKDFRKLRANYNEATKPLYKTPLYKNKKVFLALILIVLLAYLLAEFLDEKKEKPKPAPVNKNTHP